QISIARGAARTDALLPGQNRRSLPRTLLAAGPTRSRAGVAEVLSAARQVADRRRRGLGPCSARYHVGHRRRQQAGATRCKPRCRPVNARRGREGSVQSGLVSFAKKIAVSFQLSAVILRATGFIPVVVVPRGDLYHGGKTRGSPQGPK